MSNTLLYPSFVLATAGILLIGSGLTNVAAAFSAPVNKAEWNDGVVILVGDKVLNGEVHYNSLYQLLLLRSGEGQPITTFTARQVQRFFYYNPQDNIIHRFLTLEQYPHPTYAIRSFYEIVAEGSALYLRQPNQCSARPPHGSNPHTVAFHYFAYYQGRLVRAHAFEKNLLPALMQEKPALEAYLKAQHLQPYHIGDQILLVNYFNRQLPEPLAALTSRW